MSAVDVVTGPADPSAPAHQRRVRLALAGLLLATFVEGSAELLAVGLLPTLSEALGVSVAAGGALVSAYALGLAVGGPLLTAVTIRLDRRLVVAGSTALFALLTVSPAVLPSFGWFVTARFAAGALQGLLMAAAFVTATSIVGRGFAGRAIAVVMAGFAVATVIGLPLGVLLGAAVGWRGALLVVGASTLVIALVLGIVVPSVPGSAPLGSGGLRRALSPPVLAVLALTLVQFAAPGAVLTYLMPLLERVTGVSGSAAGAILVAFGVASVAGSFVGGRLADRDAARGLVLSATGLVAAFGTLFAAREHPIVAVVAILAWAVSVSSAPPSIQSRAMTLAGPSGALVAALPASAGSAGIALGSAASGVAFTAAGPPAVVLTGLLLATGALALAVATRRLRPPLADLSEGEHHIWLPGSDKSALGSGA